MTDEREKLEDEFLAALSSYLSTREMMGRTPREVKRYAQLQDRLKEKHKDLKIALHRVLTINR